MRKPRIMFSIGLVLLPVAGYFLAITGWFAYSYVSRSERVDATVVSVGESRTFSTRLPKTPRLPWSQVRDGPPQPRYWTGLNVEFDDHGSRRAVQTAVWSTDPNEHERVRREYAVGTRHSMRLQRNLSIRPTPGRPIDPKLQKVLPREITLLAPEIDRIPGLHFRIVLVAFGAVLLTAGMVHGGKKRGV